MICMYLPPQGQDGVECRFIVDNMKEKSEKDGKYNNDDERLSRDLKKHNWLMNKLKERFDVSDTLVPEKSTTSTDDREVKKPQRVGRRRHSIAISSAKCKSTQHSEEENSKESQKENNSYSDCEIIDYSLKKPSKYRKNDNYEKSQNSFTSDQVIYDLSKRKYKFDDNDYKSESQPQENNTDNASDEVYDLSKNKNIYCDKMLQSNNGVNNDTENSVNYLSQWSNLNEHKIDINSVNLPRANISDSRKMRRIDKHSISDCHSKTIYTRNVDDSSEQEQDHPIIKHNLPFGVLPRREKTIRVQSPATKDKQKVDISVQTDDIFTVSKDDWSLLKLIKSKGITEDKILRCSRAQKSEINLSDVDSDNENGVINIHILRKLLEHSEKNKNMLNKTYDLHKKSQYNSAADQPVMNNYNNEKQKNITKVFDILMSEYDQRLINDKSQSARDSDIWQAKRRKLYNPVVLSNESNLEYDQNKTIESDIDTVSNNRTSVPQKPEPTRPQLYHYPLSWSRQSASPYETQNIYQLPYKYQQHNFGDIDSLSRKANPVCDYRVTEYPKIPHRLEPHRLSQYTNQQVNYLEQARGESNIHYGPIQQNNQYINIRGAESPHRPYALHPIWCGENRIQHNSRKISNSRNEVRSRDEDLYRESRYRESNAPKMAWESEITNYPNTDWRGTK